jgi:hypothetical protein
MVIIINCNDILKIYLKYYCVLSLNTIWIKKNGWKLYYISLIKNKIFIRNLIEKWWMKKRTLLMNRNIK